MDETEKTCKTCKTKAEALAAKKAGMSMGQLVENFKACMLCTRHPAARTFAPFIRAQGQEPSDRWVPRDAQKREG
jgi:hypothetical protein